MDTITMKDAFASQIALDTEPRHMYYALLLPDGIDPSLYGEPVLGNDMGVSVLTTAGHDGIERLADDFICVAVVDSVPRVISK